MHSNIWYLNDAETLSEIQSIITCEIKYNILNFCLTDICNIGFIDVLTFGTYFNRHGISDFARDDISVTISPESSRIRMHLSGNEISGQ